MEQGTPSQANRGPKNPGRSVRSTTWPLPIARASLKNSGALGPRVGCEARPSSATSWSASENDRSATDIVNAVSCEERLLEPQPAQEPLSYLEAVVEFARDHQWLSARHP